MVGYHLKQTGAEVQEAIDRILAMTPGQLDIVGIYAHDNAYWTEHAEEIPAIGTVLLYLDSDGGGRIKLGDGQKTVEALPFVGADVITALMAHIENKVRHISKTERDAWNNKVEQSQIADFVTKTANDLVNYYLKDETYSRAEIQGLLGAKVTLTATPSTIYKDEDSPVLLVGRVSNINPTTMTIWDGDTVIATSSGSQSVSASVRVLSTANTKEYTCQAVYSGTVLSGSVSVNARHPIYCGMGANYLAVVNSENKVSPTTTAARTYNKTALADGQHFYLLVPSDIGDVNNFSMGGVPFAMNAATEQSIGGVTYRIHESTVAYDLGAPLSVTAS